MTAGLMTAADARRLLPAIADVRPIVWWCMAYIAMVTVAYSNIIAPLTAYLGDADDAARLLQVREFMASGAWFDTTTLAMGGHSGLVSHWSRLIDLPLAASIAVASLVVSHDTAELLARAIWPLLILAALSLAIFRATGRARGPLAGLIALPLMVLCPLGLYQFAPGRIDHHNAMIAASVGAALLMWSRARQPGAWAAAGLLCGLALAIGYEALAPAALIACLVALWGLFDREASDAARAFTIAMVTTFTLAFFLTIAPERWLDIRCDAVSLNLVALLVMGGGGLVTVLGPGKDWPLATRAGCVTAAAVAGAIAYGALEPRCLAGPLGQTPAELKFIWLDRVAENRSIVRDLFAGRLEQSLGLVVYFAIAIAAQAQAARQTRSPADVFLLCIVASFCALACWQYKFMSYASFIAVAPIAIAISALVPRAGLGVGTVRLAAIVLASQTVLLAASDEIDGLVAKPDVLSPIVRENAEACTQSIAVRELGALEPGLIASHIDVGAYIPALTHHRVLSAPYHRIPDAIIANHHLFASRDPSEAAAILKREGIDYITTCRGLDDPAVANDYWKGTLRAKLVAGEAPDFLVALPALDAAARYHVWRVNKAALSPRP